MLLRWHSLVSYAGSLVIDQSVVVSTNSTPQFPVSNLSLSVGNITLLGSNVKRYQI